jgi:hypothetical protein
MIILYPFSLFLQLSFSQKVCQLLESTWRSRQYVRIILRFIKTHMHILQIIFSCQSFVHRKFFQLHESLRDSNAKRLNWVYTTTKNLKCGVRFRENKTCLWLWRS